MLSRRAVWTESQNDLTRAKNARRERGLQVLDLTESNPTRAGIEYPEDELSEIIARAARARYDPEPLGLLSAREALAADLSRDGETVSPDDLVLTASTSEAYSYLWKVLADPGDEILTPAPSYPLLDHLVALESVRLSHVELEFHGRWTLERDALAQAMGERTRAVAVVHPNNPTGSYLSEGEQQFLLELCAERDVAAISDEVFFDYPLEASGAAPPMNRRALASLASDAVAVSLGGLSKSAGLPHLKLGWIRLGGARLARVRLREALELVADSFLSVATPVQVALPELLALAPRVRERIRSRTIRNLAALDRRLAAAPEITRLPMEGGWSAVLRVPRVASDEDLAVQLLETHGVLVHPGYFFDFRNEGHLVVSLLATEADFGEGIDRVVEHVAVTTR